MKARGLSGICLRAARGARARPAGEVDRRALGSFVSDSHGRDHDVDRRTRARRRRQLPRRAHHQLRQHGRLPVASRADALDLNTVKNVQSVYRTPLIEVSTKCVFTNTTHVSAYRGAGRPEGNYYMERLIDAAARRDGDRPARAAPAQPHQAARTALQDRRPAVTYDSGDFPALLKQALEVADVKGFAKRKRESRKRGKLRGLGIGSFLEVTAPPSKELGGIRFEPTAPSRIITGTLDFGMGHATPFAQVLSDEARRPVREDPAAAGRQRPAARRRRLRRLEVDHAQRHRDRRSRRQGDRAGQADRLACARSRRRRHRVRARSLHHRRHRPLDRHHGAGRKAARRPQAARRTLPNRSTSSTSATGPAPRPSRTAAMSPRSRSIRRPA